MCLKNVGEGMGAGEGPEARDGLLVSNALDMARKALLLTEGCAACASRARAHEIAAVCILAQAASDEPDPDPLASHSLPGLAQVHLDPDDATSGFEALFDGMAQHAGTSGKACAGQGRAAAASRHEEALEHVRLARDIEPMDARLLEREALILACMGRLSEARESLMSAHSMARGLTAPGVALLALVSYVTSGEQDALPLTEALQASHPSEPWVLMLHGRMQLSASHHDAALAAFFRVICGCGVGAGAGRAAGYGARAATTSCEAARCTHADWAADYCDGAHGDDAEKFEAAACVASAWQRNDLTSRDTLAAVILLGGGGAKLGSASAAGEPALNKVLGKTGSIFDGRAELGGSHKGDVVPPSASSSGGPRQRLLVAAWLACADVYLAAGLLQHARTSVALARRNSPVPSAEVEFYEGLLCEASQVPSDAMAHYSKALAIRHKHPPSLIRKAALILEPHTPTMAANPRVPPHSAAGGGLPPSSHSSRAAAARALRLLGRIRGRWRQVQHGGCSQADALKLMAAALQLAGKDARALRAMQAAIAMQHVRQPPVAFTWLPLFLSLE
jgi:tetratricopeptide (TPR) repeat protein